MVSFFIETASSHIENPTGLALAGLLAIFLQVKVCFIGSIFYPPIDNFHGDCEEHESLKHDDHEEGKDEDFNPNCWPNTTQPAIEHHDSKP